MAALNLLSIFLCFLLFSPFGNPFPIVHLLYENLFLTYLATVKRAESRDTLTLIVRSPEDDENSDTESYAPTVTYTFFFT